MRVFVQCPQGHRFVCDDRHLGKRVLCAHNGCGEKFRLVPVELGEAGADLPLPAVFDHGGRCAFCHSRLELGSIVCRHCGMNLKTGERLRVIYGDEDLSKHVEREPSQPWLVNPDEKIDL